MTLVVPFAMGSGGFNPPPTNVADRVLFGVCRPNLVGPNGRRAGFNLRVDSNGYKKSSIGTSGQRHILPLSDRTSRLPWHPSVPERVFIGGGRLRLAGRPLDSLNGLHTPPRPYHREYRARCSAASDKLTSWFPGSQAQTIASEGCALWRRQRSQFAEKLAVQY